MWSATWSTAWAGRWSRSTSRSATTTSTWLPTCRMTRARRRSRSPSVPPAVPRRAPSSCSRWSRPTRRRHETLQPDLPGFYDRWEGDQYPQLLIPGFQNLAGSFSVSRLVPHPLLCGPHGVIDRFPDHMHEGGVVEDADVQLDLPLDIAGYDRPEYPPNRPVATPAAVGGTLPGPVPLVRPVPHVVAHGITTNRDAPPRVFAIVGAYDGEGAGVGRIVVDSTWHHWFSLNLGGFIAEAPLIYEQMQWYYRNIAIYLATRAQRAQMLFAAIWNAMI